MLLDVPDAALLISEPLGRIVPTELLDELSRAARDVSREIDRVDSLQDDVVGLHGVAASEGRAETRIKKFKYKSKTIEKVFSLTFP